MKQTNKNMTMGIPLGLCFGMAIGTALDNLALGAGLGMMLGMLLGMLRDRTINEQLETQGYTVRSISEPAADGSYTVVLVNRAGEETAVAVSKGTMEVEDFRIGDMVFLDEDGEIEQAFDREDE